MAIKVSKRLNRSFSNKVLNTFGNGGIAFFHQNYMLLAIASLINHINTDYTDSKSITYNNLVSSITLLLVFALPVILFIISYYYFEELLISDSIYSQFWGYHFERLGV